MSKEVQKDTKGRTNRVGLDFSTCSREPIDIVVQFSEFLREVQEIERLLMLPTRYQAKKELRWDDSLQEDILTGCTM